MTFLTSSSTEKKKIGRHDVMERDTHICAGHTAAGSDLLETNALSPQTAGPSVDNQAKRMSLDFAITHTHTHVAKIL